MIFCRTWILCLITIFSGYQTAGLRCYTCTSANSNSRCRRSVSCRGRENSCSNTVRMENGMIRITKSCAQLKSCQTGSRQNRWQCTPTVRSLLQANSIETTKNLPPSVCRTCCTKNNCNKGLFLQEAVSTNNGGSNQNRWRALQPSIRDVSVRELLPGTALITFVDLRNHSSDFFTVRFSPQTGRIMPITLNQNSFPGYDIKASKNALAYLANDISAGIQYRIRLFYRFQGRLTSQQIFSRFVTKPRPPSRLEIATSRVNSLKIFVGRPRYGRNDRLSYYSATYRKASEPASSARRLPNFNRAGNRYIYNLRPATEYVITAWSNVVGSDGRLLATSDKVTINGYTAVPGLTDVKAKLVHATSITWSFRVPSVVNYAVAERFVVGVRDDSARRIIAETALPKSSRSYTATGLRPRRAYTFSIRAELNGRRSATSTLASVYTLLRCYSCSAGRSAHECDHYIDCPSDSDGCSSEVRRQPVGGAGSTAAIYRINMQCRQTDSCNLETGQRFRKDCQSGIVTSSSPMVCRCCCKGDLCNGPAGLCGQILQYLGRFRAPEVATVAPPFCPVLSIKNGYVNCTNGNEIGSECTFSCTKERDLEGDRVTQCFDNGRWSSEVPECLPLKTCPSINASTGTIVKCSNQFRAGSVCSVSCRRGYIIAGENQLRCQASGKWSEKFIPRCLFVDHCRSNPCLNGATCHPVAAGYECQCADGYTGTNCQKRVVCAPLQPPENGKLMCTDENKYGSLCRHMCNPGYMQQGTMSTKCLKDEYWSAYEPTKCISKTCPAPPQILVNNGTTHCSGHNFNDTCTFSCPPGLYTAGGPPNITCQADETWSGKAPCCDLQCPPHARIDLYFLLDSSSSVGLRNWKILINFTIALLDRFVVGPEDLRVGVGRYNSYFDKENEILFGEYANYQDLKDKLYNLPYNGRGTFTGRALMHVHKNSLKSPGNRPKVPDVLIVITDGRSKDRVRRPSSKIKTNKDTKLYAIGIVERGQTYVKRRQLHAIASDPSHVHVIEEGYKELAQTLSATLIRDFCWIPCQYQYQQHEIRQRPRHLAAMKEHESKELLQKNSFNSSVNNSLLLLSTSINHQSQIDSIKSRQPLIEKEKNQNI